MSHSLAFDVLIIGSGIAGLTSAIKLAEAGLTVAILTREEAPEITNTYWAQGGIIYPQTDPKLLIDDIDRASSFTSNHEAAYFMARKGPAILEEILLKKAHTDFAIDSETNKLKLTREAAHSESRIIYKGDYTGKAIELSLLNHLRDEKRFPNVTFLTGHTAIDLITPNHHGTELKQRYEDHRVVGAYAYNQKKDEVYKILARKTILASGGIGALYLHHSNAEGSRGDGQAMAKRAGAMLINMEFVQFHPTTFYDRSSHRRFLISEAVRGEGAILLNDRHEAFMDRYHPDRELAPRDVVARSILAEMLTSAHDCVYLDISFKKAEWIRDRFPTIYQHCLEKGIDITKNPIPVVPAAHYTCGGIKTNLQGQTTLHNLYAVGEVACNGLHGANRLASTSLLEGLTWGYTAAENILKHIEHVTLYDENIIRDWGRQTAECDMALVAQDWLTLKQTMWNYVGPRRSPSCLKRARRMLKELAEEVYSFYYNTKINDSLIGLRNAIEVATEVVWASIRNKKSVGCFYIEEK